MALLEQVLILKFAFGPENFPGLSRNWSLGLVQRAGLVGKSGITVLVWLDETLASQWIPANRAGSVVM